MGSTIRRIIMGLGIALFFAGTATPSFGGSWHCEKKMKSGKYKVLKKAKTKRKCKKKGGDWVKHEDDGHDHGDEGHAHGGSGHSHD